MILNVLKRLSSVATCFPVMKNKNQDDGCNRLFVKLGDDGSSVYKRKGDLQKQRANLTI